MLLTSNFWIHRRVDSLRLDVDGDTRRFVSINFTLPQRFVIPGSGETAIVPFAIMEKKTIRRLDASDVGGRHSSILMSTESNALAVALIMAAANRFLDHDFDSPALRSKAIGLVTCKYDDASGCKKDYLDWLDGVIEKTDLNGEALGLYGLFIALSIQFAENFLFCAEMDGCVIGRRSIFKYSLDQESPYLDPKFTQSATISQDVPDFGFAASQHVEVQVPAGLKIVKLELHERESGFSEKIVGSDVPRQSRNVAHCSARPRHRYSSGRWIISLKPEPQGLYRFTVMAVVAVCSLVALGMVVRIWDGVLLRGAADIIPSASASILLVGPALLLSWISRQHEHDLVSRLLAPLRIMLLSCAVVLVMLAVLAAVPVTLVVWQTAWWVAVGIAGVSLVSLLMFRFDLALPRFLRNLFYTRSLKGTSK